MPELDGGDWATIIVAVVALVTALLSQRSSSKASKFTARSQAEEDAYVRARAFDKETIAELKSEKAEHLAEIEDLTKKLKERDEQIEILRWRVTRLEQGLPPAPYPFTRKQDDGQSDSQG
jgi:uncharacterized protein involved in exopolysaccharide biosynthesis